MKAAHIVLLNAFVGFALASIPLRSAELGAGLTGFAAADHIGPGYLYEHFSPVNVFGTIDDENFVTGAFVGDDYTTEYMLDSAGAFFAVDTTTAAITPIGDAGQSFDAHISISADAHGTLYAVASDEDCQGSTLYVVDVNTGAMQVVGATDYCVQSIAFDASGAFYQLDSADGNIVVSENGTTVPLGPLGLFVPINDTAQIVVDPVSDGLYLFQYEADPDPPIMIIYSIDKTTGAATSVGGILLSVLYAVALAPPSEVNPIFRDGFESE